jgi:Spy/CpxP family protein refolding chaperone
MDGHLERRLDKLGLSSDQSDKVHAILDAAKAKREEQRPQIEAAMDQMHTLLEQDPPDETAIMQQADKLGTLKTEGHKEMLHTLLQVRAQLTPAQRDQLKTMHPHGGAPPWHHHRGCGKGTPCPEDQ